MKARLGLAAAIVVVLVAGVALAVIRPGDLAGIDAPVAQGPGSTSTTTTTAAAAAPPTSTVLPSTTTTSAAAAPAAPAVPTTVLQSTTTTVAGVPGGGSDLAAPGEVGGGPPELARTGASGRPMTLGLVLLLVSMAARGLGSRKRSPQ